MEVQPGPYPTPESAAQQPPKRQKKVEREDASNIKLLVKYGRWSKSGRSWFANRRSVPGDRPPPHGAKYSYRPVYFNDSPTPQERHSSVASSEDSEPIITHPRRRSLHQRLVALENAENDLNTVSEAEYDGSSDDSNPIIIRRRRRPLPPIRETSPLRISIGSYLSQQSPDSPLRESSLASDLQESVQNRVRRRDNNLRRSNRLKPRSRERSRTPPIASRTRRSRGATLATSSRLRSGAVRKDPVKLEESEGEDTAPESSEHSEAPVKLEGSESDEAAVASLLRRSRPPRPVRRRPSPQPSASWVRRSQRPTRASTTNPPLNRAEPGRMTLEEWMDEENALELTPPYQSSSSEYGGG